MGLVVPASTCDVIHSSDLPAKWNLSIMNPRPFWKNPITSRNKSDEKKPPNTSASQDSAARGYAAVVEGAGL